MTSVLYVTPALMVGGIEKLIYSWVSNLNPKNYSFDVVAFGEIDKNQVTMLEEKGCHVYQINFRQRKLIKRARKLEGILKLKKYDAVHVNSNVSFDILFLIVAKKIGVPIRIMHGHRVYDFHDNFAKNIWDNLCKYLINKYATRLIACSKEAAVSMFGIKNTEHGNVQIIKNGIDIDLFKYNPTERLDCRAELGLDNNYIIGHVARFNPVKNQEFTLDFFEKIVRIFPDAILLFIGDGPTYKLIEKSIENKKLGKAVKMLGVRVDINRLYQAMDLFVLPSINEGFGLTLVEAQTSGLTCLVSDNIVDSAIASDTVYKESLEQMRWIAKTIEIKAYKVDRIDAYKKIVSCKLDMHSMIKEIDMLYR